MMSALCLMCFNSKRLSFNQLNNIAKDIVKNALLNSYAVSFNDSLAKTIKKDKELNTSILLSDSFLYRNADDLLDTTEFAYKTDESYRNSFIQKYSFLSQLVDIVFHYEIESIDLYIIEQGYDNLIKLEANKENLVEKIFEIFMSQALQTGYTFPDLKIHIVK